MKIPTTINEDATLLDLLHLLAIDFNFVVHHNFANRTITLTNPTQDAEDEEFYQWLLKQVHLKEDANVSLIYSEDGDETLYGITKKDSDVPEHMTIKEAKAYFLELKYKQ